MKKVFGIIISSKFSPPIYFSLSYFLAAAALSGSNSDDNAAFDLGIEMHFIEKLPFQYRNDSLWCVVCINDLVFIQEHKIRFNSENKGNCLATF